MQQGNWVYMSLSYAISNASFKGLITVGLELRQQHPRDMSSGGDVPRAALSGRPGAGQQITRVFLA